MPIYPAILVAGGAEGTEVVQGYLGATVIMVASGRPYGLWLDLVRSWFGLPPGGARSMSVQR